MAAMGRTLWAQGDMDHASAWLQQAWDLDPSSPALTADLITVLLLAERSDDALDLGQLVDDELPAELCLALGRAALANDPERASPFLARYLDAWPRDTDAWLDLARAQLLVDAPGPARLSAEQALSLRADDVDGLRLLGLALMGLDRPLDARRPLRQALTLGAPRGLVGPMLDRLDQLVEAEQRDASDEPAP
jgi:tetratricopeptide (TPR) repeat protein